MTQAWEKQRERGSPFMTRLLVWIALNCGRSVARLFLYPTVAWFLCTSGPARRASRNALRRLLGREPGLRDVAKNFFWFASCSVDRLYLLSERRNQFEIVAHRPADVAALTASGRGAILLTSHLGGFEPIRALGIHDRQLPLSILLDRKLGEMVMTLLERVNPGLTLQVIDASLRGPELVLQLKEALQAGRLVGMGAERALADERAFDVEFFGGKARFRESPWIFAAALGVPVIIGFGLYRGGNRYDAYFELFSEKVTATRATRQADLFAYAQRYAERLEHYARLAPYNWFNFYDYWNDEAPREARPEA
jgi:predicted LPLAT superfamily acyltransferase